MANMGRGIFVMNFMVRAISVLDCMVWAVFDIKPFVRTIFVINFMVQAMVRAIFGINIMVWAIFKLWSGSCL